jgi:hypothetical protein
MQDENQNLINTEENVLQQNIENNYSVPQYAIPEYSVPQDQQPQIPQITPNYQPVNQEVVIPPPINNGGNKSGGGPTTLEILSFLSWFLYISAKWDNYMNAPTDIYYSPLLYNKTFIDLITLIISVLGFLIYLKNIIYARDEKLYQALFGDQSKFHIIPLITYSVISMILNQSENTVLSLKKEGSYDPLALNAFYFIFSLISLASIIFVYIKTEMDCEWYVVMTIKKGIYSFIIVESLYHVLESIFALRFHNIIDDPDAIESLEKTGGVFFVIILSGLVGTFASFYKNIIMIILNFLIYFTIILNFYTCKKMNDDSPMFGDAVAVIDIIMLIANFVLMIIMIIKFKEELLQP